MKSHLLLLISCISAATTSAIAQQSLFFGSPVPATGTYSSGGIWTSNNDFYFEVGAFAVGFNPTNVNFTEWSSNWSVANQSASGTATWVDDDGDTGFSGAGTITTLGGAFVGNAQIYIWAFDSQAEGLREWALFTDNTWLVPADISNPGTSTLLLGSNTVAIVGSVTLNGTTLTSEALNIAAIPEPTTYAAFAGMAIMSLAVVRRRKVRSV